MADGPINYETADPQAAILNGLKLGAGIQQVQAQQQQQQLAQQAAIQQQTDLARLASNPNATHADFAAVMTKYPALAEHLGKAQGVLDEGQKQNALNFMTRADAALRSGNGDLAASLFEDRAKADPAEAQHWSRMADFSRQSPGTAKLFTAASIAGLAGPEKYAEKYAAMGAEGRAQDKAPGELAKVNADASTAGSEAVIKGEQAKVAPQATALDLQKKGWDITKIQADIANAKEDNRIKAMNAAISRETNDLKRQELRVKIDEATQKRTDAVNQKAADLESARGTMDNLLNTVDRLKKNPGLNDVLGSIEGNAAYPNSLAAMHIGGSSADDRNDAIALIDTIGSQAFLAQVPNMKGMGSLSNAEGEKLQSALQNLNRKQSETQFRDNLEEIQRLTLKARSNVAKRYGAPESIPDTPAVAPSPTEVDALVKKYTGGGK